MMISVMFGNILQASHDIAVRYSSISGVYFLFYDSFSRKSHFKDVMSINIYKVDSPAICKVSDMQGHLDRCTDQTRHGELDNGRHPYPLVHATH
jgi:hypothetical protein